jgi:hypothetical protein
MEQVRNFAERMCFLDKNADNISIIDILMEVDSKAKEIRALLLEVTFHSADVVCVPRKELEEVVRISDRKHDAWDAVKKAIAASPEYVAEQSYKGE